MNDPARQTIDIFGYQPIRISDKLFQNLIATPDLLFNLPESHALRNKWISFPALRNDNSPDWINTNIPVAKYNFALYYPENQQTDILKKDLCEHCHNVLGDQFDIDTDTSSFSLVVNKFNCFMLIYHVHMVAGDAACQINHGLVPSSVRHAIEPHSGNDWSKHVEATARQAVLEYIKETYSRHITPKDIEIGHSSLHIVSVFNDLCQSTDELKKTCLRIHEAEETRNIKFNLTLQAESPNTIAHFGWSYSTMCNLGGKTALSCLPIIYYQQQNWYMTRFLRGYILKTMLDISQDVDNGSLQKKSRRFDKLVVAFKLFLVDYADFKSTLKPFQWDIAYSIENYWKLSESYEIILDTFTTVRDYIGRKFTYKSDKIQRRQNLSLLIIALIQLIGIISVLESYLSLIEIDQTTYSGYPFIQWVSNDFVRLTIPLWLILVSVVILFYIYNEILLSGFAHKIRKLRRK